MKRILQGSTVTFQTTVEPRNCPKAWLYLNAAVNTEDGDIGIQSIGIDGGDLNN
jgi:hypothetical protein